MDKIDQNQSSPQERGKRLKILRNMTGLTIKEFSKKYKFGESTIKHWEIATASGLSEKGASKIIAAIRNENIQCSVLWLLHGIGSPPRFTDPSYMQTQKTSQEHDTFEQEESNLQKEKKLFCQLNQNAITMLIADNGMEPLFQAGDYVGGIRCFEHDIESTIGKNCIVETFDKQLLCRRVEAGTTPGLFNLYCINPNSTATPAALLNTKLNSSAPISRIWKKI